MVIDNIIFINLQKLSKLVQYWMSYGSAKFGLDARRRSIKLCRATTSSISGVRRWFLHINVANDVDYHIRDRYICTSSWSQSVSAVVIRCQISHVHTLWIISSSIQYYFNQFFNYTIAFNPSICVSNIVYWTEEEGFHFAFVSRHYLHHCQKAKRLSRVAGRVTYRTYTMHKT